MKKLLQKLVSAVLVVAVMSFSFAACATDEVTHGNQEEGFMPESDSTWGDVYRHFDPEGFQKLPTDVQTRLDCLLLESVSACVEEADGVEEIVSSSPVVLFQTGDDTEGKTDVIYVSGTEYLYSTDSDNVEQNTRDIDIAGLIYLPLGVSSTRDSIEYTTAVFSTIACPYLYVGLTITDTETGRILGLDSNLEENTTVCNLDGTFTGLQSNHEYRLTSTGVITPPPGYFCSGNPTVSTNKMTK